MTSKQAIFIILVNALISTLISVSVALVVILPAQMRSSATQPTLVLTAQVTASPEQPLGLGPAESAQPTATPILYVVQAGDTLSSLAVQFDVPAIDIMAANQIQNPDFLQAGVELVIPVGGLPPVTITWTPLPIATGTPLPFQPPSVELSATAADGSLGTAVAIPPAPAPTSEEFRVQIMEIVQVGNVEQERAIIANTGGQVADMEGWTLSDADGNTYLFPNYRLWAGGSVTLHTRVGQDGNPLTSLFWGRLQPVWSPGEAATLKDADGQVIATYAIGP